VPHRLKGFPQGFNISTFLKGKYHGVEQMSQGVGQNSEG
jgi:hypothetical protein